MRLSLCNEEIVRHKVNLPRIFALLLVTLLAATSITAQPVQANTQAGIPILFPETGHTLGYSFRQFYDSQGGVAIFGLPLTEVFIEDGLPVQYFERARFEWHATVGQVQAGHLGRWAAQNRMHLPAFAPQAQPSAEGAFFPETGHSLKGAFLSFWQQNGGLETFGYPLSEEFAETNDQDGQSYTVQYFERARFELHRGPLGQPEVLLGHLGRQYLAAHPAPAWAVQPVASADQAWSAVRPSHIRIPRIGVDVNISMNGFSYGEWEVPRYTAAQYWPVSGFPNTAGNIVLAGHVGYSGIIFSSLPNAAAGDEIFLTVNGADRRYIIDEVLLLLPRDTWVMNPTSSETLTLITCYPVGVYSHRLIVRATPAP
jgi:LPXTG-site transpeptidase (sortase) family protein